MKRLIYVFKKIGTMDYARMWEFSNKAAKKHHRFIVFVLFDMLWCSLVYGAGYSDYYIYNFTKLTANQRATFVTIRRFDQTILTLNDKSQWDKFDNKFIFNQIFKDYVGRFWCDIRSLTYLEYESLFDSYPALIIKPHDGISGKGVKKLTKAVRSEFEELQANGPYLLEECIQQADNLKQFNSSSINTLRIQTLVKADGQPVIFSGVLRLGVGDTVVDNAGSGGIYTLIRPDGALYPLASNDNGDTMSNHPISKIAFEGFVIEHYLQACQMVMSAALVVPTVRFVGWDVAMSVNGPVIIEGNQCPGYDMTQNTNINQKLTGDVDKFLELCPKELSFLKQV